MSQLCWYYYLHRWFDSYLCLLSLRINSFHLSYLFYFNLTRYCYCFHLLVLLRWVHSSPLSRSNHLPRCCHLPRLLAMFRHHLWLELTLDQGHLAKCHRLFLKAFLVFIPNQNPDPSRYLYYYFLFNYQASLPFLDYHLALFHSYQRSLCQFPQYLEKAILRQSYLLLSRLYRGHWSLSISALA